MAANPALLESIAFFGAALLGLGIAALGALGLWRAISDERPLLLAELLALEGIEMGEHVNGGGARRFALAARRCMRCAARQRCEDWLAGRDGGAYQAFCPNAPYVASLKQR